MTTLVDIVQNNATTWPGKMQNTAVARTATVDGLTTAIIAAGTSAVDVTSSNSAHYIVLPVPVKNNVIGFMVGANGFRLQSDTPASVSLNGASGGGSYLTIPANTYGLAIALSTTAWVILTWTSTGNLTSGVGALNGQSISPRLCHTGGMPARVSTDGTELDIVVTELYVSEVFVPAGCTITGAAVFWGTNTNGNAKVCLFDSQGTRVAISASTDVSGFTGDSYGTRIAFSSAYTAKGPGTYYLGVICDDNTNDINTHTLGNFGAGKITGLVYATEAGYATITPPTTFTTGLGPIATLY